MVKKAAHIIRTVLFIAVILFMAVIPAKGGENPSSMAAVACTGSGKMLVPLGKSVGIKLFSSGVMIVALAPVETGGATVSPAHNAGLREGDVIYKVNGAAVSTSEALTKEIEKTGEKACILTVGRGSAEKTVTVKPVISSRDNKARIGAWVRDSMAGIGTLTYYDPDTGIVGALGHGICDVDTGQLMPLSKGILMPAAIAEVKKGLSGTPGELCGAFDLGTEMGTLYDNNKNGVYGRLADFTYAPGQKALPVAARNEIKRGAAVILCNVEGDKVEQFGIEITQTPQGSGENPDAMCIRVTDSKLIAKTGGIVQGMSGSPIIQNGRIIGAVTHVLVNDPLRGYGIFIGAMLESSKAAKADAA